MKYYSYDIILQEVPNEISLSFSITGCNLMCVGCHSAHLWKKDSGLHLDENEFKEIIYKYKDFITCIVFMGGEWYKEELINLLKISKTVFNLKTCLYSGLDDVDDKIKEQLTFLKTGKWDRNLGGLDSLKTNQRFIDVVNNKNLNYLFHEKEASV
jgi:anaerobic ribonucleoside-triphosphate reductase activating protein